MRYGAKGNGFFEEKGAGQAQGAATWKAGFEALEPHGGVGRVERVEGQIDGQGTKLGTALVSFGARRLDSFANKQNSTARGWGCDAECLWVELELPPCVHNKNPHENTLTISSAAQNNIPTF